MFMEYPPDVYCLFKNATKSCITGGILLGAASFSVPLVVPVPANPSFTGLRIFEKIKIRGLRNTFGKSDRVPTGGAGGLEPRGDTSPAPGRSIQVLGKNRCVFSRIENSHGCRLATVDIAIFPKSRLFKLDARKKNS